VFSSFLRSKNNVSVPLKELPVWAIICAAWKPQRLSFELVVVLAIVEIVFESSAHPKTIVGGD